MALMPAYYTTLNTKRRKKPKYTQKKFFEMMKAYNDGVKSIDKKLIMNEDEFKRYLYGKKRIRSNYVPMVETSIQRDAKANQPTVSNSSPFVGNATKPNTEWKKEISSQYVIGQAYNKGGLTVLSKREANDPATGKRR